MLVQRSSERSWKLDQYIENWKHELHFKLTFLFKWVRVWNTFWWVFSTVLPPVRRPPSRKFAKNQRQGKQGELGGLTTSCPFQNWTVQYNYNPYLAKALRPEIKSWLTWPCFSCQGKTVHFLLAHEYFDAIKRGEKCWEFRKKNPHWQTRLNGARWASFSKGSLSANYTTVIYPKYVTWR